uniref:Uncharacterized protein n=1 Tax=Cuerna arida TaxID=1464854 RepID=A0A1B6GAG9_9HEMI
MKFFALVVVIFSTMLFEETVLAWLFKDEHSPRPLDGSLRCYQCNAEDEHVCTLNNWKHANVTEKRNMIMQCPRRKSAFCHLVLTENSNATVRGCSGPTYTDGRDAHIGCFSMMTADSTKRVCLCDSNLCNTAGRPSVSTAFRPFAYALLFLLMF